MQEHAKQAAEEKLNVCQLRVKQFQDRLQIVRPQEAAPSLQGACKRLSGVMPISCRASRQGSLAGGVDSWRLGHARLPFMGGSDKCRS